MSDSEPSYYEIALTNRQVLSVFVILLVCLVAAFFAGVWVGREGLPGEPGRMLGEAAEAPGEPPAIGELNFFSEAGERNSGQKPQGARPRREPPLAQVAEEPRAETTLLEDVGGPAAAPAPRRPAPAPAGGETALEGELVIQVFSSLDKNQAEKLRQRLASGGYPAFLLPEEVRGQTMYRVRVGPYGERAEADAVADRVRREYRLDTWITQ